MTNIPARANELLKEEKRIRSKCFIGPLYFGNDLAILEEFHRECATELEALISESGWPGYGMLCSWEGVFNFAELVRSCWSQPRFMKRVLALLEQSSRFGETPLELFAAHYDTIMYFENKPQVFGSYLDWDTKNHLSPWKIIDSANVHQRRRDFVMVNLDDYISKANTVLGLRKSKPPGDLETYYSDLHRWALKVGWDRRAKGVL